MKPIVIILTLIQLSFLAESAFPYDPNNLDSLKEVFKNKIVPKEIEAEAYHALSFYPELVNTHIEFEFKDQLKSSFMNAQPKSSFIFRSKKKRKYSIKISRNFHIEDKKFTFDSIPSDVLTGWLGHELGHVMDYLGRGSVNMIIFGARYLSSKLAVKTTERTADLNAITHGMGDFIYKTRNFILDHAHLSENYKDKIRNLYLSPEDIMQLIEENYQKEKEEEVEEEIEEIKD